MYQTTDGHALNDLAVRSLIGASLPTPQACKEAVRLLTEALAQGITQADLWELSRLAVWESLDATRGALEALRAGRSITTSTPVSMRLTADILCLPTWATGSLWDAVEPVAQAPATTVTAEDINPFANIF